MLTHILPPTCPTFPPNFTSFLKEQNFCYQKHVSYLSREVNYSCNSTSCPNLFLFNNPLLRFMLSIYC